jgi:hypothetical protein
MYSIVIKTNIKNWNYVQSNMKNAFGRKTFFVIEDDVDDDRR